MVATKKNTETASTAHAAAASTASTAHAGGDSKASAKSVAKKTKVVKKVVAKNESEPEEKVVVETPVTDSSDPDSNVIVSDQLDTTMAELSRSFFSKMQGMSQLMTQLKSEYRAIEKKWQKEIKQCQKLTKKKRKTGNRSPSGFVKPARISDELADFLGVATGIELARTDVTKEITAYIRAEKLQDETNGRNIHPDAKLKKLLQITDDEKLTYFNLQKFMAPHFAKVAKAGVATDALAAGSTV
jgi:hypothetical protein